MGDNKAQLNAMSYVVIREIKPDIITHTRTTKDGYPYVEMEAVQRMVTKTTQPPPLPESIPVDSGVYQRVSSTWHNPMIGKTYYTLPQLYVHPPVYEGGCPPTKKVIEQNQSVKQSAKRDFIRRMKFSRILTIIAMLANAGVFDIHLYRHEFDKLIVPGIHIALNVILFMIQNYLINKEEINEID